jgi:hypothetical protein
VACDCMYTVMWTVAVLCDAVLQSQPAGCSGTRCYSCMYVCVWV